VPHARLEGAVTSLPPRWRHGLRSGIRALSLPLLLLLAFFACAPREAPRRAALQVAVSVPPQAFFVERLGGSRVEVAVMVPQGQSEVDYPLSPRQMAALSRADLYVAVGHPAFTFESRYIEPFLAANRAIRKVDMSRGMALIVDDPHEGVEEEEDHGHGVGLGDPHVWVAPETVAVAARNIAAALAASDPAYAAYYRANLERFLDDVARLDADLRRRLAGGRSRSFMVYHPSWGYFARQYGLQQIAIESGGKEPSAARLIRLVERARREGVEVIFIQGGFPRKSAQVIADAVGGRVVTADPLAYDWLANLRRVADAFGEALHG
jgi:zinc transport system substrate-binding protein